MKTRSILPAAVAAFLVATTTDTLAYERGDVLLHLSFDDTVDAVGAASGSTTIYRGTPAYTNETVAPTIYWTAKDGSEQSRANPKALYAHDNRIQLKFPDVTALQRPDLTSATIEFFIKVSSSSGNRAPVAFFDDPDKSWKPPFPFLLQNRNATQCFFIRTDCFDDATTASSGTSDVCEQIALDTGITFVDSTWHHIAATISEASGDKSVIKFYFDRLLVQTATSTKFAWSGLTDTMTAVFGDTGEYQIDEFRITKGALTPGEFLRTSPLPSDGETIVHLSFDGTLDSLGAASGSTTLYRGTPAYSADVPAREVGSMLGDGKRTWRPNLKSLYVNSNMIQLKLPKILMADLERPNLRNATIECFVKGVAAEKNDPVVRLTHNQNAIKTPPFPFIMSSDWQTGKLAARLDTFDEGLTDFKQNAFSFAPDFTEGKWHHIAVTIAETQDGKSLFNFYLDGRLASTKTSEQYQWDGLTDSMSIDFGANKNNDSLKCYIDEFRISKGVLTPEAFLQKGPVATVLSFR